jgi:hypothetical protein
VAGALAVRLVDIWEASHLPGELAQLTFDLVGEDGFRPSARGHPPIAGELLARGHLQLETGRVLWDDPNMACAYCIKLLSAIIGVDAGT